MKDDRESAWPTLTQKIDPLPGGLADLQRRLASEETRRVPFFMKPALFAVACVLAFAVWQTVRVAPARFSIPAESPLAADARMPSSDRVQFFWVGAAPVDNAPAAVDAETLVRDNGAASTL